MCPHCHNQNEIDSQFCTLCGASLKESGGQNSVTQYPTEILPNLQQDFSPQPFDNAVQQTSFITSETKQDATRKILFGAIAVASVFVLVMAGLLVWRIASKNKQTNVSTAALPEATALPTPITFEKNFEGTIGGQSKIVLRLRRDGDNLSGSYFYRGVGTDLTLKGMIQNQNFELAEFETEGKQTATFKGNFLPSGDLEGTWSKPREKTKPKPFYLKESNNPIAKCSYKITGKIVRKKNVRGTAELKYPQIESVSLTNAQRNFNERMRRIIQEDVEGLKDFEGGFDVDFGIAYRSNDLISMTFNVFSNPYMAAHPNGWQNSFNYDLANDREIKLGDLFQNGKSYMGFVSRLCAQSVNKQKYKRMEREYVTEVTESDVAQTLQSNATFTFDENNLFIMFDSYEMGSYAEGPYDVTLSHASLDSMLNKDGPIGKVKQ